MSKQKVIIRADGSSKIGYGHVHRMIKLIQMLNDKFDCVFVSHNNPTFLIEELDKIGAPFIKVDTIDYSIVSGLRVSDEVPFDMGHILTGQEIVVTDGYWFGPHYQKSIKAKGCKLVCIDDEAQNFFVSDVVINHCPGVAIAEYAGRGLATSFYLGVQYSIVAVPEAFHKVKVSKDIYELLIIGMGAADPSNFTCKVLNDYRHFISCFKKVVVITGHGFAYAEQLNKLKSGYSNIEIVFNLSKDDVYTFMLKASCAILSASTIAIEFVQIGGILGVVETAKNQKYLYRGLIHEHVAFSMTDLVKITADQQDEMMVRQRNLFDGRASDRIRHIFDQLETQMKIKMIRASQDYNNLAYSWACSSQVRRHSFNQGKISLKEHEDWFEKKVNDFDCDYFIGILNGEAIGSVRFDIEEQTSQISYLLDPRFAGKGLGRLLLAEGILTMSQTRSTVNRVEGYVMPENFASISIFERMGFQKVTQHDRILFYINLN